MKKHKFVKFLRNNFSDNPDLDWDDHLYEFLGIEQNSEQGGLVQSYLWDFDADLVSDAKKVFDEQRELFKWHIGTNIREVLN